MTEDMNDLPAEDSSSGAFDYVEQPDPLEADFYETPDIPDESGSASEVTPSFSVDHPQDSDNIPPKPQDTPSVLTPQPEDVTYHPRTGGPEALPDEEGEPLVEPHSPEAPAPFRGNPEHGG